MTPRLKELYEQATAFAFSNHINGTVDSGTPHGTIPEIITQKFAELIVNDCAGVYSAIDNGNLCEGTDNYLLALRRRFYS